MTTVLAAAPQAPDIDWAAFSPLIALLGALLVGLTSASAGPIGAAWGRRA